MMTHSVSLGLPCVVVLAVWPHYPHHPSPPLQAAAHCCSSSQVRSIISQDICNQKDLCRYSLLLLRSRCFSHSDLSTCRSVLSHCYLGDWFVLYQLSKNSNTYFFRYLLKQLEKSFISKVRNMDIKPCVLLPII